jgi:glycerol uptake facilitator-like aquaporin
MALVLAFGLTTEPLALGIALSALIYMGMYSSGAHFNPAVSFAYFLRRSITFRMFLGSSASQLLGAFAAAGIILMVTHSVFFVEPPTTTNLYQQVSVEAFLTFLFVSAYLNLINNQHEETFRINALGVGLTLTACIMIGATISGGYMNPAMSISTSIIDFMAERGKSFESIPLFTVAPITGASLAALLHWYTSD